MGPHAQTLLDVLPTSAALLGREARGDSHHHMTGSLSLIREDVEKRAPTRIMNALGKMVVLHHSRHVQVFDTDAAIALRIVLGRLEMEVAPLATDLEVLASRLPGWLCGDDDCPLCGGRLCAAHAPAVSGPGDSDVDSRPSRLQSRPGTPSSPHPAQSPDARTPCAALDARCPLVLWRCLTDDQRIPVVIRPQDQMSGDRRAHQRAMQLDLEQPSQFGGHVQMFPSASSQTSRLVATGATGCCASGWAS